MVDSLAQRGVTHVFTHCALSIPHCYRVPGIERHTERALLLARETDVVCLPSAPDEDHLAFLREFGLGPRRENIVVAESGERPKAEGLLEALLVGEDAVERIVELTAASTTVVLNPTIATAREFALASLLGKRLGRDVAVIGGACEIVDRANQKHVVRGWAQAAAVPLARGEVVRLSRDHGASAGAVAVLHAAARRQRRGTGRALIRGSRGASGTSTAVFGSSTPPSSRAGAGTQRGADLACDLDPLDEFLRRDRNDFYLVDEMHDAIVSPNVLMYVEPAPGAISCLGVTDQRLDDDFVWRGNTFPTRSLAAPVMCDAAATLCRRLQLEGYSGFAGFDFVEYLDAAGVPAFFLAELNARVNGVTYPLALMQRINEGQDREGKPRIEAFISGTQPTRARTFAEFADRHRELFFTRDRGSGLVPYVSGCLAAGILYYALLGGSTEEVLELKAALESTSPARASSVSRPRSAPVPSRRGEKVARVGPSAPANG